MATNPLGMMAPDMGPAASPEADMVFSQLRQNISPKEFSDELLASAEQADPQAVAEFKSALQELDVPPEILDLLNSLVDEVLADPANYAAIRQKYMAQGVTEDVLPEQFDPEFFAALNVAVDQLRGEPAGPQAFANGGIAELKPIAKAMASYGRNGDTMLAHITPAEARMLRRAGGSGTVNPHTGLPEFFLGKLFSKIGSAVKSFAKSTVGRVVLTVALGFLVGPAAASMLGVTSAAGVAAVGGFIGSAGSTLLAGGSVRDALKAGAIGGITAGIGAGVTQGAEAFTAGSYTGPTTISGQFDRAVNAVTPGTEAATLPNAPELPAQQTLPELPGSGAESYPIREPGNIISRPLDKYDLLPDSFGNAPARMPAGGAPSIGVPDKYDLLPDSFGNAPARLPGGVTPANASPAVMGEVAPPATLGGTTPPAAPAPIGGTAPPVTTEPGFFDNAKSLYNRYLSPSGIEAQALPEAQKQAAQAAADAARTLPESITGQARAGMIRDAYNRALTQAMPGTLAKYGPMAAAGLGIMGLAGGFKQKEVTSPYADLFTGGPGSAKDLMTKNPYQYYIQGLPGVRYFGGSVLPPAPPPPPPGYAYGGEVQYFSDGGELSPVSTLAEQVADDAARETPAIGATTTVTTPTASQIGTPAATSVEVATPAYGGYNNFSPAAQNTYYDALNKGLLSGTRYDPTTRSNVPIINPGIYSGTAQQKADYYNELRNKGFTDEQLRAAVTPQSDDDWKKLQEIAGERARSPQGTDLTVRQERAPLFFPSNERLFEIESTYRSMFGRDPNAEALMRFAPSSGRITEGQLYFQENPDVEREFQRNPYGMDQEKFARTHYDLYGKNEGRMFPGLRTAAPAPAPAPGPDRRIPTPPGDDRRVVATNPAVPPGDDRRVVTTNPVIPPPTELPRITIDTPGVQYFQDNPDVAQAFLDNNYGLDLEEFARTHYDRYGRNEGRQFGLPPVETPPPVGLPPVPGGGRNFLREQENVQLMAVGGIAGLGAGGYPRRTGQISGPGTEKSDSIPAMLSDGEFVMTAKAVRGAGGGSRRAGAKKLYALMHRLEQNASRG